MQKRRLFMVAAGLAVNTVTNRLLFGAAEDPRDKSLLPDGGWPERLADWTALTLLPSPVTLWILWDTLEKRVAAAAATAEQAMYGC